MSPWKEFLEDGLVTMQFTGDEKAAIAAAADDVIQLQARALLGEDVDQELAVVNATLANIAAGKAVSAAKFMQDTLTNFVRQSVLILL